jgi:leucyl-tRNA synthetase
MAYNFKAIEKKWQARWEENKAFKVSESSKKKKCYVLEMYPYPSASFLHMGHVRNYAMGDVYSRFKRLQGFNVLYPMGYDSFGLPAETAAKKQGIHPKKYAEDSIKKIQAYQKALGNSYDWSRTLASHEPEYYKWNQYFFLKLFGCGLAYRKKAPVNWCENCQSVLANEEAEGGKCWRCEQDVTKKEMEQWFFKITAYADELIKDLDKIQWPEQIKTMQKNWIGRSEGVEIDFEINGEKWPVFTTRPDTICGVTFMVISSQHPKLMKLVTKEQKNKVDDFLKKLKFVKDEDIEKFEKDGVFTGSYAVNPLTKEKVPVYAGNFVVADYGSGMVMAVPCHDARDYEFADKYHIPKRIVIQPEEHLSLERMTSAYTGVGRLVNSGQFDNLLNDEAKTHITKFLEMKKLGKKKVNYKIRDWMISRQRYWGTPIPIIHCGKCGIVAVSEKNLPVLLPEKVDFKVSGNPLNHAKNFVDVKCPKCKGNAIRETDTMGGFVDSSWYFLRYCDNKNKKEAFDKKKIGYWMPVNQYIGGAEHAVMHLMYARFFTKVLRDMGFLKLDEPFMRLFNQGIVYKDGHKMSKSFGNVVYQTDISEKYGIDAARLFLMGVSSPEKEMEWNDEGAEGSFRFLKKVFDYFQDVLISKADAKTESRLHKAIMLVTGQIENLNYNIAIINIRKLFESLPARTSKEVLESSLKLLHPFCPHITEELWEKMGNKGFISLAKWPVADEKKINEKLEQEEEAVEKLIRDINNILGIVGDKKKVSIYALPDETQIYRESEDMISKKTGLKASVYSVSDRDKYDPEGKAKKAKSEKPALYLE